MTGEKPGLPFIEPAVYNLDLQVALWHCLHDAPRDSPIALTYHQSCSDACTEVN